MRNFLGTSVMEHHMTEGDWETLAKLLETRRELGYCPVANMDEEIEVILEE